MAGIRTAKRLAWAALAAGVAVTAMPPAAHAWWRGRIVFGFPVFPAPIYVPPPVYYPPPPVYYAPPPVVYAPPPSGQSCYAGPYVCPLDRPAPVGGQCWCPTNNNGRIEGRVS